MIRLLDILLSSLALLVLAPVLLPIALLLRVTGEGEVFFRQQRVGKEGRLFGLLKFATMLKNSPNLGSGLHTLSNDPRVLPVGRFLRNTKINELPQLINILKGDMSVIGPRPQAPAHFDAFPAHVREQLIIVSPGLSGIGSIVFRDEERLLSQQGAGHDVYYRDVISPYKGELELWYLRHRGLRTYLLLIALTVLVVLTPENATYKRWLKDLPSPPEGLQV